MSDPTEFSIKTTSSPGAVVTTTYVERQMKAYAVYEDEVSSLSYLNTQSTIFFMVASSLVSFALGIWTNAAFATDLTPAGEIASKLVAWVLCVLGFVFFGLGGHAIYKRHTAWKKVVQGSRSR